MDGGLVVTMDEAGTVIPDGAVAVRGNRIEAVGPAAELAIRFPGARRLDASGRIVMPGLINAHTHVPMTLFRGVADDLDLKGFLYGRIFPLEARFVDEEFVRWGTRLACLELLRGGVTTFVDMYYFEDAIAEEAARCGMRAVVGETLIDFPAPDNKSWADALAYTERFLARWRGHRADHAGGGAARHVHRVGRPPAGGARPGREARRADAHAPGRGSLRGRVRFGRSTARGRWSTRRGSASSTIGSWRPT